MHVREHRAHMATCAAMLQSQPWRPAHPQPSFSQAVDPHGVSSAVLACGIGSGVAGCCRLPSNSRQTRVICAQRKSKETSGPDPLLKR